jgi:hypothetical protein
MLLVIVVESIIIFWFFFIIEMWFIMSSLRTKGDIIMVLDTPPYGHAPTYQISLTYLERQKSYGPDKLRWEEAEEKIRLKQYVFLCSKGRHNYTSNKAYVFLVIV